MGAGQNMLWIFLYYFSPARKWTNCAIVPMKPLRPSHALFPWQLKRSLQETKRPGVFKNAFRNVRKAYFDSETALKLIFSIIKDQCSGGQWSSKWGTRHFKTSSRVKFAKQRAERLLISSSLTLFWSCLKPILEFLKMFIGSRNHYEVKWSLYKLQNMNNLPKDYIRMCLTCRSLAKLFNFIGLVARQ